jgi:hypothetical protein
MEGPRLMLDWQQRVTLTVKDGEHSAVIDFTTSNHWPGREPRPITDMIQQVCDDMIAQIHDAEINE